MTSRKVPLGLKLISVYMASLAAIAATLAPLLLIPDSDSSPLGSFETTLVWVLIGICPILFFAATSLCSFEAWSRRVIFCAALINLAIGVTVVLFPLFYGYRATWENTPSTTSISLGFLLKLIYISGSLFIVFYLSRKRVKALFLPEENQD